MPPPIVRKIERACPAKLNLRLAVCGQRGDGFHELRSIVTPISLHDDLTVTWKRAAGEPRLTITGSDLPPDADNLVLRAVRLFAQAHPIPGSLDLHLHKRIPVGAGLGGGSSDAAATLLALQTMWGHPLPGGQLLALAVRLGADVPFFLEPRCALMRGLGEQLQPAPALAARLAPLAFLVFKPWIGIDTRWAYRALAARGHYQNLAQEEAFLARTESPRPPLASLPFNAFRAVVDERLPSLPVLLQTLNRLPGLTAEMSGSGSACFAFARSAHALARATAPIRQAWGGNAFLETVSTA